MHCPRDPRLYQIACLAGLLAYGVAALGFEIGPARIGVTLASALAAQAVCGRLAGVPRFDPRSALISGLSLCLLLRTDSPAIAAAASAVTIASKFVLRVRGKHVFNPTNFGVVVMIALCDRAWASAGQWGTGGFFAFLMACLGGLVLHRAWRSDVAWAFSRTCRSSSAGRPGSAIRSRSSARAAERRAAALHVLHDLGPAHHAGRARGAHRVRRPGGRRRVLRAVPPVPHQRPALVAVSTNPLVPLLDRLLPGDRYLWPAPSTGASRKGDVDATLVADPGRFAPPVAVR